MASQFLTTLTYINLHDIDNHRAQYQLVAPLKYKSETIAGIDSLAEVFDGGVITIPTGFKTDLASIPWPLSNVLKPNGPWKRAAVVHDYLCTQANGLSSKHFPGLTRSICDGVFYEAMRSDGISAFVAAVFWVYVRGVVKGK